MKKGDALDPRGLIYESYRMRGITEAECRSIFLDWALAVDAEIQGAIDALLDRYGNDNPKHPMTTVLRAGLSPPEKARRKGGWRSRKR
ncbi:hypothetical protein Q4577_10170 [Marinovum sp. 2_MG-2023]|uniref:hypothetical protein n=1 Tax=Roseobacteraceae TaxID=2854170 RepID=UPI001FCFD85A|nr:MULTISPECIES: hypothetical protein [Roseobacteraceae]MCJ7873606.1 hypothetical protein [Phaeobacter sp. J2-8]MDO6730386.1 hypothetical protein [Marinovum sp. 2_MG-2023]MDO6778366.1 hypothetical protein [Marinovum sp. 1_MG-2023]